MHRTRPMLLSRLLPWVLGLALGGGGGLAWAQATADQLPPDLMQLQGGASPQQQQAVRGFVSGHLSAIADTDAVKVVESRDAILTALRAGSPNFKTLLGRQIVDQIDPLLASDMPLTRINALLLLQSAQEVSSISKVLPLLNDEHAGVRFAAVSAVQSLLLIPDLPAANRSRMLSALDALARSKADPLVIERCLIALYSDGGAESVQRVLDILVARLPAHQSDPAMTFLPESKVFTQLVQLIGKQNPEPVRRQIVTAAARYHLLSLLILQQREGMNGPERGVLRNVAVVTDQLLSQFSDPPLPQSSHPTPRTIDRLFDVNPVDWDALITRARLWIERLTEAGFPTDQLQVTPPATGNPPSPAAPADSE